jgi:hypothetical protein
VRDFAEVRPFRLPTTPKLPRSVAQGGADPTDESITSQRVQASGLPLLFDRQFCGIGRG